MSVAFRVATATALLILLLLAVLSYHVTTVQRFENVHRDLSTHQVQAILVSLEHRRLLDRMGDNVRKFGVTADARYAAQIDSDLTAAEQKLQSLRSLLPAATSSNEIEFGLRELTSMRAAIPSVERLSATRRPAAREELIAPALALLDTTRANARTLIHIAEEALTERVEWSSRAVNESQQIAWAVFAAAFVLGLAAVLLTVTPINRRLKALVEATRNVSEENYLQVETPSGDEFSKLTAAFNSMIARLAELDQLKKNLLSHVSHELRTPLASIQESQTLLLDELPGRLNAQQKRLLEHNVASCSRLSRLISNLLDLSRMEAGAVGYSLADHDLRPLLAEGVEEMTSRATAARMRIESDLPNEPLMIVCDRDRLAQVLRNLLENALKFSPAQRTITVRASVLASAPPDLPRRAAHLAQEHFELVLFEVSDEGPGLPPSEREKVFGRFYRVDEQGGAGRGVGLGLAICREIITAHGGAIWVTSNERGGSTFRVVLPCARVQATSHEVVRGVAIA